MINRVDSRPAPDIMQQEILKVQNVCKWFNPGGAGGGLSGRMAHSVRALSGRGPARPQPQLPAALSDVSFSLRQGEAVAILGRNGAGKSTLLQIIAGTLRPSTGAVWKTGRVAAMLELGFGFNADFTGRENIDMAAAIHGIPRRDLKHLKPLIEAFSEIGDYLDRPLRTYSTGMVVRLAFAIITVSRPTVLIIDEALSVGDIFFQAKCVQWLENYLAEGGTLLCATHDFQLIQKLCKRALVLHRGSLAYDGTVVEAINTLYRLQSGEKNAPAAIPAAAAAPASTPLPVEADGWHELPLKRDGRTGDRRLELLSVQTFPSLNGTVRSGSWLKVRFTVKARETLRKFDFGLGFRDRTGQLVGGFHSFYSGHSAGPIHAGEELAVEFSFQLFLKPQEYLLIVGLAINHTAHEWEDLDCHWDCAAVNVIGQDEFWGLTRLPYRDVSIRRSQLAGAEGSH